MMYKTLLEYAAFYGDSFRNVSSKPQDFLLCMVFSCKPTINSFKIYYTDIPE